MPEPPDEAASQALARARQHALRALSEALEAGRALLDAASLASTGGPAAKHPLFASADARIQGVASRLVSGQALGGELAPLLAEAVESEIARWERRAVDEEEARAVLRAFLGLRELLWEVGVRPAPGKPKTAPPKGRGERPKAEKRPLERVAVVQS